MFPDMKFLSFNARSLFNKMDELTPLVCKPSIQPSFIAIQETWANPTEEDGMYNLPNYTTHRQDRNGYGGGVALYVSNTTTHERLDIGMIAAESVWIAADSSRGKIAVASIYRPPRADVHQFSEELEIGMKAVRKNYDNILLLGDFNATHSLLPTDKTDSMGESLHCLLSILNLQQHTNFSTHIHRQLPSACLDLVISNISSEDLSVASLPPLGASDHIVISGDIKYKTKQLNYVSKPNRTSWKWSQDAVGRLRQALLTTNLVPEVPHNRSVNGFWSHWKHKVISLAEQHCKTPPRLPNSQQRQSPSRPWITKDLLTGIKLKHKLYRTYLHDRSAHNWESFTSQRNKVTTMLRRAKSTFVLSQSHPDNFSHSNLHKVVKCLKTKTCTPIPDLINQSQNAKTPLSKATMLNNFFIQQSQQSVSNNYCNNEIPRINTTPTITSTLTNFKTTPTDVEDLLQQLDTSKSNGSDGIPTRLLKEAASELAPSLSALFNLSFETGQTPQEWRDATVTPIHKKGTKSSPTNYRPISLLPVVSKVQERVVYNRLYSHIQQHLPTHQSGFRQCDGTELQLARINHEISAHRDSGHHVSACFFDLSKAFDRVWHPGLLKKLFHYGVEAEAHIWLTGYLSGRRQRVQVDGTVSPWLGVPAGVPQGSVLGPLLFLTYTIDLPNACINDDTTCGQFADDTALIASTSSPQQTELQLQRAVTSAAKWLNDWHLLVNIDKTVTMTFYHDNRPPAHLPTIFLNDSPLKTVRQQRHLGVIFQHNLQWSTHVNNIINKSLKVLHMLTKLRNSLNSSALSYLYCTYIRPILEYACIAVTPLPHNILDRLERI